jgi:hypothetical protein
MMLGLGRLVVELLGTLVLPVRTSLLTIEGFFDSREVRTGLAATRSELELFTGWPLSTLFSITSIIEPFYSGSFVQIVELSS